MTTATTKKLSTHAHAAKLIREYLKQEGIKGSVVAGKASMLTTVDICLENASPITRHKVTEYAKQFQYGNFNGMNDTYESTNSRKDIPQVKYVTVDVEFDDNLKQKALDFIAERLKIQAMDVNALPLNIIMFGQNASAVETLQNTLTGENHSRIAFWDDSQIAP